MKDLEVFGFGFQLTKEHLFRCRIDFRSDFNSFGLERPATPSHLTVGLAAMHQEERTKVMTSNERQRMTSCDGILSEPNHHSKRK